MGKSTPKAPDPVATANAQAAANKEAAIASQTLSMVDQYTPQGSLTYTQIPGTGPQTTFDQQGYDDAMRVWNNTPAETWEEGARRSRGPMPTREQFTTTTGDSTPRYQATTSYSPEQQALYESGVQAQQKFGDIANSQLNQAASSLSSPYQYSGPDRIMSIDRSGLPDMRSSASATRGVQYDIGNAGDIARSLDFSAYGDPNLTRTNVENALLQRLQPSLDSDRAALETQLANQGLTPGTPAYDRAIDAANRQSNDARLAAIAQAGTEQSRLFGLGLNDAQFRNAAQQQQYAQNANNAAFFNAAQNQEFGQDFSNAGLANSARAQGFNEELAAAQFANNARDAQIAQELALRQQPLNEVAALLSGSQVQSPSFVNTPTAGVQAPDIAGLMQADYQNRMNAANAANQGLFGLLGTGVKAAAPFIFSDRRMKRDITPVGRLPNGLTVYSYRYTWKDTPELGLMADEVAKVKPWAVQRVGSHDMVNYAEAAA
jgi:hypothetical protein